MKTQRADGSWVPLWFGNEHAPGDENPLYGTAHVVIALRDMIKLICARTGISREDAYTLCSLAADLRVTQVVNGAKGIHIMLEKKLLQKGRS